MKKKIVLIIFPLILIIISTLYFEKLKNNYGREFTKVKIIYEKAKQDFTDKDSLKRVRANYFAKIFLLDYSGKFRSALLSFFSDIKKVLKRYGKLSEFEFIPDVGKVNFTLRIKTEQENKDFSDIFRKIEDSRNVLFVSLKRNRKFYIVSGEIEIE